MVLYEVFMKMRSFLAFDITDEMRAELAAVINLLESKSKGIRWVEPKGMHCTIRFFGEVEEELLMGKLAQVIEQEVRHQSPIGLVGRGFGVFPNWRYPRVLWAGLGGDVEAVISLHRRLEEAFSEFGFKKDPRELRLHLTLGRAKSRVKDSGQLMPLVEKMSEREFGKLTVSKLTLYKSDLTKEGPIYTPLKVFSLGGDMNT